MNREAGRSYKADLACAGEFGIKAARQIPQGFPNRGKVMARMVQCVKLGKEAEGLERPTYPGELGKRIYLNVSKEAWKQWLGHQTMLINEYRLTPVDPKARKFLEEEMDKFFFGGGSEAPKEFVPPAD
jgi:Fe-S cluster biosynthesis and repair protein YggX